MQLKPVTTVGSISPKEFRKDFYQPGIPIVIKDLAKQWPAYTKWNWDYFKELVGDKKVALYNNVKSDAYTPINTADDYKTFAQYVDIIHGSDSGWRIFLFNIFQHAPQLIKDFSWPEHLMKGFLKKYPMLFTGGANSITHMHFDIDLSHIIHTQFGGRKRVLMFPYAEQHKLYRKPFEVLSLADFSHYYANNGTPDYERFPALKLAEGFDFILDPGDTLFMPAGYWHHMEYIDNGFAMSLRAFQPSIAGKIKGFWNLVGMRSIDTVMKKTIPKMWYGMKEKRIFRDAQREMNMKMAGAKA